MVSEIYMETDVKYVNHLNSKDSYVSAHQWIWNVAFHFRYAEIDSSMFRMDLE